MYFLAPFVLGFMERFPHYRRPSTFIGLTILTLSLVASSFATAVWQLILSQGIFYAFGGCMLYLPCIVYLDEWFVKRKGLALGTNCSNISKSTDEMVYLHEIQESHLLVLELEAWLFHS